MSQRPVSRWWWSGPGCRREERGRGFGAGAPIQPAAELISPSQACLEQPGCRRAGWNPPALGSRLWEDGGCTGKS